MDPSHSNTTTALTPLSRFCWGRSPARELLNIPGTPSPEDLVIDYMLMNLGILAASLRLKPEDIVASKPVPDDSHPPKDNRPSPQPIGPRHGLEGVTIAESFYSPIRRTDFL